jgi:hypothetical protein
MARREVETVGGEDEVFPLVFFTLTISGTVREEALEYRWSNGPCLADQPEARLFNSATV